MSETRWLTDLVHRIVERSLSRRQPHRVATVSSYDPNTHSAKFMRMPESIETGFLPLNPTHVGNGWGVMNGPQVGDQYVLGFINGDVEVPFVVARLFSDKDKPPVVQSGEMLWMHQKGHYLKADADGNFTLYHAAVGGTMKFDPAGNITHDANGKSVVVQTKGSGSVTVNNSGTGGVSLSGGAGGLTMSGSTIALTGTATLNGLPIKTG